MQPAIGNRVAGHGEHRAVVEVKQNLISQLSVDAVQRIQVFRRQALRERILIHGRSVLESCRGLRRRVRGFGRIWRLGRIRWIYRCRIADAVTVIRRQHAAAKRHSPKGIAARKEKWVKAQPKETSGTQERTNWPNWANRANWANRESPRRSRRKKDAGGGKRKAQRRDGAAQRIQRSHARRTGNDGASDHRSRRTRMANTRRRGANDGRLRRSKYAGPGPSRAGSCRSSMGSCRAALSKCGRRRERQRRCQEDPADCFKAHGWMKRGGFQWPPPGRNSAFQSILVHSRRTNKNSSRIQPGALCACGCQFRTAPPACVRRLPPGSLDFIRLALTYFAVLI